MKARGPWLVFAVALVVVGAVMAGVTAKLVALERERTLAQRKAAQEEEIRLVLWRLDTAATPLLSQEIGVVGLLADAPDAAVQMPRPPEVRVRFVAHATGEVDTVGDPAEALPRPLERLVRPDELLAALPGPVDARGGLRLHNPVASPVDLALGLAEQRTDEGYDGENQQKLKNAIELSRRTATVDDNVAQYGSSLGSSLRKIGTTVDGKPGDGRGLGPGIEGGPVRPMWLEGELVLVRRVQLPEGAAIHGSWIDWPALRERLLAEVRDALPGAELLPVRATDGEIASDRLLATLPVRLAPGLAVPAEIDALGVLGPSLALAWLGLLAAALAVFMLLRWSLALSERRAAFVSAVTHELRTPLTTFRMYAEMLAEGMVDEGKRARYVGTLRREADRLGDLVENVLAYSRVESERVPLTPEVIEVGTLVERTRERLLQRAHAAGLELQIDVDDALARTRVCADPSAVEQILFNLVDNAAKYGPSRESPRIVLDAREVKRRIGLGVRDFGPGIPAAERETIFEPFAKASADASGAKPGVGLGLSLSRRLARQLGGDLGVETADPGARFVLTLPRA